MIFSQIPALLLQEDAALQLLRARWNGGYTMPVFQAAASQLVELAQAHGTQRMLLELNDLPDVPVFDQLWLTTTLLPLARRLSVRQLVVILSGKRIYNRHLLESLLAQFHTIDNADIQFFTQPEQALDWLTDHSPRVPELQAEWRRHLTNTPLDTNEPGVRYKRF